MEFEDILKQVGEYGRYQKRLVYFFLIPAGTIFALLCMNTFFMLSEPNHWCHIPAIQNLPKDHQKQFSKPKHTESENKNEFCSFYDIDYHSVLQEYDRDLNQSLAANFSSSFLSSNTSTKECNDWIFDKENWDATAVTEVSSFIMIKLII